DARRGRRPTRMNALAALAFTLAGIHVGAQRVMPIGYAPTWSPSAARIAFVTKGDLWVADADGTHRGLLVRDAGNPAWSPNGRRLAYVRNNVIYVGDKPVHRGQQPAWRPPKRAQELLPDFDQRAPSGLTIAGGAGRWLLGFTSLVDNIGIGPSELIGVR